jgi:hypothetical protein
MKGRNFKTRGSLTWSIRRAATEFGVSEETVRRGLSEQGVELAERKSGNLTTRQIAAAIFGDLDREKILDMRQRRLDRERAEKVKAGELIPREVMEAIYQDALGPIRQRLLSLPAEAGRCNPDDPAVAREVLEAWLDATLAKIRKELR